MGKVISGDYAAALAELSRCLKPAPKPEPKAVERTFQSYAETEWAQYTADHWKASTQITQGSHVRRHIRPHFDALNLSGIRASDIVAFHASMEEKGLSKKTRRSLHSILTRMFSYAVELELLDHTPASAVPHLQGTNTPRRLH